MLNKGSQNKIQIPGYSRNGRLIVLTVAAVITVAVIIYSKRTPDGAALSATPLLSKQLVENPNDVNQASDSRLVKQSETVYPKSDKRSLFAKDPNIMGSSVRDINMSELFYKMLFLVGLVVALGGAAFYVSKKYGSRFTGFPGGKIQVLERTHIAPHKMVFLLKVGNQKFLIGSTREHLTMLAEITNSSNELGLTSSAGQSPFPAAQNENISFKDSLKLHE